MHNLEGNKLEYASMGVERSESMLLAGKKVLFLGSSVTFGYASLEDGIPEYFARRFGCEITKEAVNGTTLVDKDDESYVNRLKTRVSTSEAYSLVVCQLSTNDANLKLPLGELTDNFDMGMLDTSTITGASEYIIAYVKRHWSCPVVFYTGSRYNSDHYEIMVRRLHEVADKWEIGVLDLWESDGFNFLPEDLRSLYMCDPVHPTRAGYMRWWCPEMEHQLIDILEKA